jgi:hypothetical protein
MSTASPPRPPGPAADVDPLTLFDPAKREPDLRAMTRIVLQPIGSPMPLGFFTVAIDSVLVSALHWGLLPAADRRAVALIVFPRPRGTADRAARDGPPRHPRQPGHAAARHRAAGRCPPDPLTALPAGSVTAARLARAAKGVAQ